MSGQSVVLGGHQHRRRKRRAGIAVLAGASLLALAACSGSSGGSGDSSGQSRDSFTYALSGVPTSLDPADYQGNPSRDIGFELGSALIKWDTEKLPKNGCDSLASVDQITGELAESWTRSDDGKTIRVKLRDAKSPAGNQLTADDVKWTFDRLIALKVGTPDTLMHGIAHYAQDPITVADGHSFDIHVEQQSALDLAILTWPQFRIIDSVEAKKHATPDDPWAKTWLADNSAVFGPWKQSAFDSGNRLTLEQNPNYTADRGDVKKLTFLSVPDASSRAQLVKTGDADFAAELGYDQYDSMKNADGVELQTCASADRVPLVLNENDPNLANLKVRQAVTMAINRDAIVQAAYKGLAQPAKYGLTQSYDYPKTDAGTYTFDVDKAKQLMTESGVGKIKIDMAMSPARPGPEAEQVAILIKNDLEKIGITVNIKTLASASEINTAFHDGSYNAMLYLEPPAIADPYYSLFLYNSSKSGLDTFGYKNPTFDQLTAEIGSMEPGEKRSSLVSQAAEIIVQDPPFIYLVDKQFVHALRKGFTNYQHAPNGEVFVYTLKNA